MIKLRCTGKAMNLVKIFMPVMFLNGMRMVACPPAHSLAYL